MTGSLADADVQQYRDSGYLCPVTVVDEENAARLRGELEGIEQAQGHAMDKAQCNKSYLLFDWADELVHHPVILDAVESLIGPDILCLMSNLFTKEAGSGSYVSMHQDNAYWGVEADDIVTAWVALSPATAASGVMKVEPGSHTANRTQVNTYAKDNLLTRGQAIPDEELNPDQAVYMELQPGEMSLHHFRIVHGSDPNLSDDRRIGIAIRYVAADAKTTASRQSALLVRGRNKSDFHMEQRTGGQRNAVRVREHAKALRHTLSNVLSPEKDAPLGETIRLKLTQWAGIGLTYWRQVSAR